MGQENSEAWMSVLPWILLAKRTALHSSMGATSAELVFGENQRLLGKLRVQELSNMILTEITSWKMSEMGSWKMSETFCWKMS